MSAMRFLVDTGHSTVLREIIVIFASVVQRGSNAGAALPDAG
jgi:hypothetical protein